MAVRTATAIYLDTKISALMTSLDSYLAIAPPPLEDDLAAAKYFLTIIRLKLRQRVQMRRLLTRTSYRVRRI